jgi:hypothetical protein
MSNFVIRALVATIFFSFVAAPLAPPSFFFRSAEGTIKAVFFLSLSDNVFEDDADDPDEDADDPDDDDIARKE